VFKIACLFGVFCPIVIDIIVYVNAALQRTTFLVCCLYRIDPFSHNQDKANQLNHRLLGLIPAPSNMMPFVLLCSSCGSRPPWGVNTFSHDQGYMQGPSYLGDEEEALFFLSQGPMQVPFSLQDSYDRCFPHKLWNNSRGLQSLVAHKLPGDDGCFSGFEIFSSRPQWESYAYLDRQHNSDCLCLWSCPLCKLVHHILLWS